jgi:hypothetical protein
VELLFRTLRTALPSLDSILLLLFPVAIKQGRTGQLDSRLQASYPFEVTILLSRSRGQTGANLIFQNSA